MNEFDLRKFLYDNPLLESEAKLKAKKKELEKKEDKLDSIDMKDEDAKEKAAHHKGAIKNVKKEIKDLEKDLTFDEKAAKKEEKEAKEEAKAKKKKKSVKEDARTDAEEEGYLDGEKDEKKKLTKEGLKSMIREKITSILNEEEQMGSYGKFLKVVKSYEDEEILSDFLDSYPKGQDISKSEYERFTEKHLGLSDPEDYRGKNWKYIMSEGNEYYEDDMKEAEEVDIDVDEKEDIDVDIEKDVEVDDVQDREEIEVDAEVSGQSAKDSGLEGLLKKAREMAREQGDDKLVRQISNTIIQHERSIAAGEEA